MARREVVLTPVYRSPGDSGPWHLIHPLDAKFTLCGVRRGSIRGLEEWGQHDDAMECRRCARLHDLAQTFRCLGCVRPVAGG